MKQGLNTRRSRGRGNPRGRNPNSRTQHLDSNGPEGRIRGTANQILDRYLALARDAQTSGDWIGAENLFQHAEHYFRLLNVNGAQGQPMNGRPRQPNGDDDSREESEASDEAWAPQTNGEELARTEGESRPRRRRDPEGGDVVRRPRRRREGDREDENSPPRQQREPESVDAEPTSL